MSSRFFSRHQVFFGLVTGAFMLCVTMILIARFFAASERPVYAASTDVKGSPYVAIASFMVQDANNPSTVDVKVVYADGHVSDPTGATTSGTVAFNPPVTPTTGSLAYVGNAPGGYGPMYTIGADGQLYEHEGNAWAAAGSTISYSR